MDVWLLLAAAGSSYLARRWQNAQKTKGTAEFRSEGECSSPSTQQKSTPAARGRTRRFSSTTRRQPGRLKGSRRNLDWCLGARSGVKVIKIGEIRASSNSRDWRAETRNELHNSINGSELETVSPLDRGNSLAVEAGNAHENEAKGDLKTCEERISIQSLPVEMSSELASEEEIVEETLHQESPRHREGKAWFLPGRTNENRTEESSKSTELIQIESAGKRMKDSIDDVEDELFLDFDLMPGLWDHPERFLGFEVLDFLVQQEEGPRSTGDDSRKVKSPNNLIMQQGGGGARTRGSCSRRVKTPSRSGRSMNRRKGLIIATSKPMSSLESCLSAQLLEGNDIKDRRDILCTLSSPVAPSEEQPSVRAIGEIVVTLLPSVLTETNGQSNGDGGAPGLSKTDSILGLPPLSKWQNGKNSVLVNGKLKREYSHTQLACISSKEWQRVDLLESMPSNYLQRDDSKRKQATQIQQAAIASDALGRIEEPTGFPQEGLLFNFGVGVGMMFTIMSKRMEVKKLAELLQETEVLVKNLEQELEEKCDSSPEDDLSLEMESWGEKVAAEERYVATGSSLKKVRSVNQLLGSIIVSFSKDYESKLETMESENMVKLEAELEAELERMEHNIHGRIIPKHLRRFSGSSEVYADIVADVVQGELTIKDLPYEIDVESEEDGSQSPHEEIHVDDYAVSPRELECRLHEVLEFRQGEVIAELEAEVDDLRSRLQEKGEELKWWKEHICHLSEPPEIFSDAAKGDYTTSKLLQMDSCFAEKRIALKKWSDRDVALQELVNENDLGLQADGSFSSPSAISPEVKGIHESKKSAVPTSVEVEKAPNNGRQKKIPICMTLGGDAPTAYSEACDEFLKVASNSKTSPYLNGCDHIKYDNFDLMENNSICEVRVPSVKGQQATSKKGKEIDVADICCRRHDPELVMNISSNSFVNPKAEFRKRGSTSVMQNELLSKVTTSKHPVLGQHLAASKVMDELEDSADYVFNSTPCSIKFMDTCSSGTQQSDYQESQCSGSSVETSADVDGIHLSFWNNHAGTNTPVSCTQVDQQCFKQESFQSPKCQMDGSVTTFNKHRFWEDGVNVMSVSREGVLVDWEGSSVNEGCSNTSDTEELLGELLIKRIVEKTRKGSPIVQEAQSVLTSLEKNEASFSNDWSSIRDKMAVESDLKWEKLRLSRSHSYTKPFACKKDLSDSFHNVHENLTSCTESRALPSTGMYNRGNDFDCQQPLSRSGKTLTIRAQQNREEGILAQDYSGKQKCNLVDASKGLDLRYSYHSAHQMTGIISSTGGRELGIRARQDATYGMSNNDRQVTSAHQNGLPFGFRRKDR